MWVTKLQVYHKDCPIVNRAVKYNVSVLSYPHNHYMRDGKKYSTTVCKLIGYDLDSKEKYLTNLKKDKSITRLDISKDIFVYECELTEKGEDIVGKVSSKD